MWTIHKNMHKKKWDCRIQNFCYTLRTCYCITVLNGCDCAWHLYAYCLNGLQWNDLYNCGAFMPILIYDHCCNIVNKYWITLDAILLLVHMPLIYFYRYSLNERKNRCVRLIRNKIKCRTWREWWTSKMIWLELKLAFLFAINSYF